MNIRHLVTALLLTALVAPVAVHAQDSDKDTELGKHMSKIGRDFKKLRNQINDAAQNDSTVALLADIKTEATAGLDLKPEKEADQPAEKQAAFQAAFQKELKGFIATVDKAIAAVKSGDNAGAAKLLQAMGAQEKKDHKQFKKPKPE
jgi:DNA-binding GntR family transcriptional regulator